jgi:hypothetical protein
MYMFLMVLRIYNKHHVSSVTMICVAMLHVTMNCGQSAHHVVGVQN